MSRMLMSQIAAGCSGKKDHRTYWRAYRAAKNLNRHRDNAKCGVYRCGNCKYWHVGNSIRRNDLIDRGAIV